MKAKAPVGHHGRKTSDLSILARDLNGRRASNKVEVKDAAQSVVLEELTGSVLVDFNIHAIGVQEEDTVSTGLTVLEVDRMCAIQIGLSWDAVRVLGPEGADVVGGLESE